MTDLDITRYDHCAARNQDEGAQWDTCAWCGEAMHWQDTRCSSCGEARKGEEE